MEYYCHMLNSLGPPVVLSPAQCMTDSDRSTHVHVRGLKSNLKVPPHKNFGQKVV